MSDTDWIGDAAAKAAEKLHTCNECGLQRKNSIGEYSLPSRKAVHDVLDHIVGVLFPGCHGHGPLANGLGDGCIKTELETALRSLQAQAETSFKYECELDKCPDCSDCLDKAIDVTKHLVEELPAVQDLLQDDIQAAFDGDPAAKSTMEIVMSYPAIQAISAHRIAHLLYDRGLPLIPRIMSELAHSRTGIDIHPGAHIGHSFFIDHGTGVVIGETAIIGDHVKIYQGVTLGAMSFPLSEDGTPIKNMKRHPHVEDNVTIYAEATILGDITIGKGSVIGGNVWLTYSVPSNSKVTNVQPDPDIKN